MTKSLIGTALAVGLAAALPSYGQGAPTSAGKVATPVPQAAAKPAAKPVAFDVETRSTFASPEGKNISPSNEIELLLTYSANSRNKFYLLQTVTESESSRFLGETSFGDTQLRYRYVLTPDGASNPMSRINFHAKLPTSDASKELNTNGALQVRFDYGLDFFGGFLTTQFRPSFTKNFISEAEWTEGDSVTDFSVGMTTLALLNFTDKFTMENWITVSSSYLARDPSGGNASEASSSISSSYQAYLLYAFNPTLTAFGLYTSDSSAIRDNGFMLDAFNRSEAAVGGGIRLTF